MPKTVLLRYQALIDPLAVASHFHFAQVVDLADGLIRRGELGPAGDVFGMPVGEMGQNQRLLLVPFLEDDVFGEDFESLDPRIALGRRRLAGGNPFGQHAIFARINLEAESAFVGNRARRL